jgi:hypothetical protein
MRDRLIPPISLLMACLCAWGTWRVASEVRAYNSNRAVGGLLAAGMMGGKHDKSASAPVVNERTGLPWLSFPPMEPPVEVNAANPSGTPEIAPEPVELVRPLPMSELTAASAAAEVIVHVWERIMYGVAALLATAGLIGVLSRWVRGPHLIAAAIILLSTLGTLIGMRMLVDPSRGAFHSLPLESYLLAGIGQAGYGVVLLATFARKQRPMPCPPPSA